MISNNVISVPYAPDCLPDKDPSPDATAQDVYVFPTSFAQQRLWLLDQLEPGGYLYNLPVAVRLQGELDVAALEATLNEIIRRHEVLRTRFGMVDGEPAQIVAVTAPRYRLEPIEVKEEEARRLARAEAEAPFDLGTGPLLRVKLLRLADEDHVVLFTMHHIISDGWSTSILVREVTALYEAYRKGAASPLPELAIQYADYAAWQREWLQGEVLEEQLSYWRRQLGGELPVLELPVDRARPAVQSYQGAQHSFLIDAEVTEQLKQLSRREDCTLFMTLLAAYQVLLCRYSGQDDVVVGTPIAGRNRAETEPLIGFFVNMLALRTDLSGNPSFVEVMRRVKEAALGGYMHQDLPFEKLVEELQPERDASRSPLFQAVFALHNQGREALGLAGLRLSGLGSRVATSKFELTLGMMELEEGLAGTLEYNTDLYEAETIRRMSEHLRELLKAVAAAPEQSVWEVGLVSAAEAEQLAQWNETNTAYEREAGIAELFERQVAQRPAAIAVVYEDEQVSYAELNERANQLAHYLRGLGVGPEVLVGVMLERSVEMIVALLAVLKAGGAYLPLDGSYPLERLSMMVEDAQPAVLLTETKQLDRVPAFWGQVLCLDEGGAWAEESQENPATTAAAAEQLAYVSYTSGSTGQPKGVMVTQRGVVRLVRGADYAEFGSEEVYLQYAPLTFDASTFEIWGSLLHGARLVLMKAGVATLGELAATVRREQVSVLWLTAGLFQQLVESEGEAIAGVRQVLAGGDVLPVRQVREHLQQRRSGKLINGYGPTESTTFACSEGLERWDGELQTVPIGRPIANTQAYVVERRGWMKQAGVGVSGELYLGGDGLARGYLQRPELTAEKFVPDAMSGRAGARLYRTGDLVRYGGEGKLEFMGRLDQQVKLRGYRIELGEIEAALMEQGVVREAVVIARVEAGGEKRLVGYVVSESGVEVQVEELRQALRAKLPEYMVPSALVVLEELPLTGNGKLDRRALPAPEGSSSGKEYVGPRTPLEEVLAGIFGEVLGLAQVSIAENFFELGGHSLLATQVISRVRESFGVELGLRKLFESPTVAGLSREVMAAMNENRGSLAPPLRAVERIGPLPLSFAQQRLWFLDQLEPGSAFYNSPLAVRLTGRLEVEALERTLSEIIRRHESLRTRFVSVDGQPQQVIDAAGPLQLAVVELSGLPESEREAAARRLAKADAEQPFDLSTGPLLRVQLLRLAEDEHVVLFTMHHIISDGWSLGVLVKEVAALYEAYIKGEESPLPELAIQYADYAAWQREWLQGEVLEEQLSYWRRQLGGELPVLELPADKPRPAVQSYNGERQTFTLSQQLTTQQLKALSQREGCTLFMTLLAAFQVLLCRYSGQDDVVVGTPIAGRNRAETESLIGFFVNMLALRTELGGNPNFIQVMQRVREVTLGAYAHQDIPFETLVEELQPERDTSRSPLFQAVFVLQNAPSAPLQLPGLKLGSLGADSNSSKFDLMLTISERGNELAGTLEYNTDLYEAETIRRMSEHLRELLRAVAAAPEQSIWEVGLVSAAEAEQLAQWNETKTAYEREAGIAELFERQVAQRPAAIAVVYEDEQVSYAELNERANQLAHHLRGLGVGPEVLVGVMLERSVEMIVALLAVLKAGGAYLPLDGSYPLERLSMMVEDAQPAVLLTETKQLDRVPAFWGQVLCLDEGGAWAEESKENPATTAAAAEQLAYVSYTSGSTGQPKGVMVTQRGVVRLVRGADYAEFGSAEVYLQYAPLTFDASTYEIWGSLLHGARLVLMKAGVATLGELAATVRREQVSVLWLTAGLFQQLVESEGEAIAGVRQVLAGGDVLPVRQVREHLQQRRSGKLINGYGPTESTTFACSEGLERWDGELQTTVPIGRPIANTQAYVVERRGWMKQAGVGVSGELYLGGDGLARGYLQRPELTAEKFVPDAMSGRAGARLYRTGDLVRYGGDGKLEFMGRLDQQVKLRGYRIELGEIEAALMEQGAVREAVVIARVEAGGEKRLVGYVVSESGVEVQVEELRQALRAKLPEYMVPSALVVLEELPLTGNGKLDRRALPAPEGSSSGKEYVGPRTPVEELIAGIFGEVLGVERVGVADNFFDLGGHSLLAVRLMACIEQKTGEMLPLATLFQSPTVELLSAALSAQMENSRWSPLVQIQAGNGERPFFCVHPGGGNVLCYAELFSHLGTERPFYGLQAYGLDGARAPLQSVEEMASRYIEAMQSVQAKGPYFIGGWSLGGLIAFEMAQQLVSRGEEIALLTLFDTSLPAAASLPTHDEDTSMLIAFAHDCGLSVNDLNISFPEFNQLGREAKLAHVLDQGKAAGRIPAEIGLAQIQNLLKVFEGNVRAGESYAARRYNGPLILFKASDTRAIGGKDVSSGWEELTPELEVHTLPGNHYNLLKAPQVQILAERMKRCFASVEGSDSK